MRCGSSRPAAAQAAWSARPAAAAARRGARRIRTQLTAGLVNWLRMRRVPRQVAVATDGAGPARRPAAGQDDSHRIYLDPWADDGDGEPPGPATPPGPAALP